MTTDELIDAGLECLAQLHARRVANNPYGNWADDSLEIAEAAQSLLKSRRSERDS